MMQHICALSFVTDPEGFREGFGLEGDNSSLGPFVSLWEKWQSPSLHAKDIRVVPKKNTGFLFRGSFFGTYPYLAPSPCTSVGKKCKVLEFGELCPETPKTP